MLLQYKDPFPFLYDIKLLLILLSLQLIIFFQPVCAEDTTIYIRSKAFSELKFYPVKKAPAQVSGLSFATLNSEVSSIIDEINVLAGDKVKKGELLIRLNCDDFSYQLMELSALKEETEANLALSKYQLSRSQKLYKTKNISEIELKTNQANVKVLKSKLKSIYAKTQLAKKNISRCEIKAPYAGIILQRFINKGEMVAVGQKLLKIADPEKSEVVAQLPIGLLDKINISESFFVYQDNKYPVTLRAMIPTIATRARHQQFHFSFTGKDKPPLNAFGELHVKLSDSFLPAELLVIRENRRGLFILEGNKAVFFAIADNKPGRPFAVSLADKTQVIIEGMENLLDGQIVKPLLN